MCESQDQLREQTAHIAFVQRADFFHWLLEKDIVRSRSELEVTEEQRCTFFFAFGAVVYPFELHILHMHFR